MDACKVLHVLALCCVFACLCGCPPRDDGADANGDGSHSQAAPRVYGRVFDAAADRPLADATISVAGASATATTNADGRFVLGLARAGTYDLTARRDGYTYAQRRAAVAANELVAVSDMYLTPLDPAVIRIGREGGAGTNSDGSIMISVPAGALAEATDLRATRFRAGRDLPNALPVLSHFTYACDLTPDGQTFAAPATVRIRNTRGFAPGTPIPVGVYNPSTLSWQPESMGAVTPNGEWVEFQVGHFSPRDCNLGRTAPDGSGQPGDATDTTGGARTERNNQNCGSVPAGSRVDVEEGRLIVDHVLPGYQSLGQRRTVALQYNTPRGDSGVVLQVSYDIAQTRTAVPAQLRFIAEIGGQRSERVYQPFEGPMTFAFRWDGNDGLGQPLPAGDYRYRLTLANEYQATFATASAFGEPAVDSTGVAADEYVSFASTFEGIATLGPRPTTTADRLAPGWGVVGVYTLQASAERVNLVGGDGSVFAFTPTAGTYTAAAGSLSTLKNGPGGSYVWTHPDGTTFTFDANGRQTRLADRNDNGTIFEYDTAGRLVRLIDPVGLVTNLAYDDATRTVTLTDPAGRVTTLRRNEAGDLIQIVNPDGSTRSFAYDAAHRMTSQTDAAGRTTTYTYDDLGALVRVDRPDGTHTEHAAATSGAAHFVDPAGQRYRFTVSPLGTRTGITDPLGRTTTMRRDQHDRLVQLALPGGKSTSYTYDAAGNLTRVSGYGPSAAAADELQIAYDPVHNLPVTVTDSSAGTWRGTYDGRGNLIEARLPGGYTWTFAYNSRGQRSTATIGPAVFTYGYDDLGNLATVIDPIGGVWTYGRDAYGNENRLTDPDGHTWTAAYNAMNLVEQVTNPAGETVHFAYAAARGSEDLNGLGPVAVPVAVTDARGNVTRYAYDALDRLTSITDALGNVTTFQYDAAGRLIARIEPNGARVDLTYNVAGDLTRKVLSTGEVFTIDYDAAGLPTRFTAPACQLDYTYDWYQAVRTVTTTFPGLAAAVEYDYRASNYAETRVRLTIGDQWADYGHEWNAAQGWRPASCFGGGFFWLDCRYDDLGRRAGWRESYSGLEAAFTHDLAGRLTSTTMTGTGSGTISWEYTPAGYRMRMVEPDGAHTYTYDAAGRLSGATHPTPDNPAEAYTYDAAGNRRIAGREAEFQYDAANRLLVDTEFRYDYDASGNVARRTNVVSGAVTTYRYDAENRLTAVLLPSGDEVSFAYDALGRRCEKRGPGGVLRYVYDGDEVLAEFDGSGHLVRSYVLSGTIDVPEGVKIGGFASYENRYYASDPVGTVLALVDDAVTDPELRRSQAFGQPIPSGGHVDDARGLAGSEYDRHTRLIHMRRRDYDPASGRFMQRDPLPLRFAIAPYVYAGNNPLSVRDPYGLDPASSAARLDAFTTDVLAKPSAFTLIGEGLGYAGDVPRIVTGGRVPAMPSIGAGASATFGHYVQFHELFGVWAADNPAQAGIDWFHGQWWNPVRDYMDDFLTLGGQLPRREARLGPVCGLREGWRSFFGWGW